MQDLRISVVEPRDVKKCIVNLSVGRGVCLVYCDVEPAEGHQVANDLEVLQCVSDSSEFMDSSEQCLMTFASVAETAGRALVDDRFVCIAASSADQGRLMGKWAIRHAFFELGGSSFVRNTRIARQVRPPADLRMRRLLDALSRATSRGGLKDAAHEFIVYRR